MSARASDLSAPETAATEPEFFYALLVGGILAATGLVIAAGGLWLAALGATSYYAIAGLGLLFSGCLILKRQNLGVWIYVATWAFMMIHAALQTEGALVAKIAAPTAMLVLTLFTLPALSRWHDRQSWSGRGYAASLATLVAMGSAAMFLHAASVPPEYGYGNRTSTMQALMGATPVRPSPAGNLNLTPVPETKPAVPDEPRILEADTTRPESLLLIKV